MADIASNQFTRVRVHVEGPVFHIRMNTPENGNLVTESMLDDLLGALALLNDLPDIKALVLSAEGTDFCQGGDRGEFQAMLDDDPTAAGIRRCGDKGLLVCQALAENHAVVTIARLHGKVTGAGLALALACDLRVGADDTRVRLPELVLGLPIAWGGMLPRLLNELGASNAREIMLTGRAVHAEEAAELSLLHNLTRREELDDVVGRWTEDIARRPSAGIRVTKRLLQAHDRATQLASPGVLDGELMAAVIAGHHHQQQRREATERDPAAADQAAVDAAAPADPAPADTASPGKLRRLLGGSTQ